MGEFWFPRNELQIIVELVPKTIPNHIPSPVPPPSLTFPSNIKLEGNRSVTIMIVTDEKDSNMNLNPSSPSNSWLEGVCPNLMLGQTDGIYFGFVLVVDGVRKEKERLT